jgi:flagellar biosynthesis GTPase FlhF
LTLQDELNDAQVKAEEAISRQEQAEAEFARQTGEFQQMVASFKNSEQQHQVELANLKERYERELEEMKAELVRVKCDSSVGREINNEDRHERIRASIHRGVGHQTNQSTTQYHNLFPETLNFEQPPPSTVTWKGQE